MIKLGIFKQMVIRKSYKSIMQLIVINAQIKDNNGRNKLFSTHISSGGAESN